MSLQEGRTEKGGKDGRGRGGGGGRVTLNFNSEEGKLAATARWPDYTRQQDYGAMHIMGLQVCRRVIYEPCVGL